MKEKRIRNFCSDCPNSVIPVSLKEKYNKHVGLTFIECPALDEKIKMCFTKTIKIQWGLFGDWLEENKILSELEKEILSEVMTNKE